MLRLLARLILSMLASAVGLIVASLLLDDFNINGASFITAVVVFSLATTILGPLVIKVALTSAPYLMGGVALVTTLIGLLVTNAFTDGLSITGLDTWILATLIIWVFSIVANLVLPLLFFKELLGNDKKPKSEPAQQ